MYFLEHIKRQFSASVVNYQGPETQTWPEEVKNVKETKTDAEQARDLANTSNDLWAKMEKNGPKYAETGKELKWNNTEQTNSNPWEKQEQNKASVWEKEKKVVEELSSQSKEEGSMVVPDRIKSEVYKDLQENPIDTESMSPDELREEVQKRIVARKAEEMGSRVLTEGKDGEQGETEADYIQSLEEKYWLDADALMSLRARNQAGIGANIDVTGEISDPEAYKEQMEELAQNAKKAQEYLAENQDLVDAGNPEVLRNVTALLSGADIEWMSIEDQEKYSKMATQDMSLGDGFSTIWRLSGNAPGGFDSMGSGIGTISTDPSNLTDLPPTNVEKAQDLSKMFGQSIEKYWKEYGIPPEWATNSSLHKVVMKESWGIVGRLNYTFWAVAKRMGTKIDDPQFVTYIHNKLKEWAIAKDFGIRSTATWVGQLLIGNVMKYYPEQKAWIGEASNEAMWMLRYIKDRYTTPENVIRHYGKHHEWY